MNKKIKMILLSVVLLSVVSGCSEQKDAATETLFSLTDKQVVFFGDSVTQNLEGKGKSYPDLISQKIGIQAVNLGFGGTSLSTHPDPSFDSYAFHSLADAIVTDDFSAQEKALSDADIPDYFDEKLKILKEINWNEVDVLSIMYGANDWGNHIENATNLMDITTFKGAGRYSLNKIMTEYPHIQVLFVPMTYRFWPEYDNLDTDSSENAYGLRPYQYSDAMVELAKEFKFPYADTLHSLGINKYNRGLYFNSVDGTHPNEAGTQKIADKIAKALLLNF
ncbi:MAG: SGNH/GDSL hydrolase family protein [Carnobacterium sp.]|uniref:SGNH/GDSL hydrolase family protein n=1 Tax=Carnobacterium sp. TaxID=48221 RepID=UPI003314EA70